MDFPQRDILHKRKVGEIAVGRSKFVRRIRMAKPERFEYVTQYETAKQRRKLIEQVKKAIRSSMEYRDYVQYLKENVDMDSCAFFKNVTSNSKENNENKKVKIEIHHEPFTLEDYVSVVLDKYIEEGQEIDALDIAEEVMELHYNNEVGLIPLSKTIHQIVHNTGKVPIPLYMCYGNYTQFLQDYHVDDDLIDKLKRKMDQTKQLTAESFNALMKDYQYLDVDGQTDVQYMDEGEALSA